MECTLADNQTRSYTSIEILGYEYLIATAGMIGEPGCTRVPIMALSQRKASQPPHLYIIFEVAFNNLLWKI